MNLETYKYISSNINGACLVAVSKKRDKSEKKDEKNKNNEKNDKNLTSKFLLGITITFIIFLICFL